MFSKKMNKIMHWVLAATLVCGATAFMTGCKEAKTNEDNPVQHPEIPLE